jgi:L-lactate permease
VFSFISYNSYWYVQNLLLKAQRLNRDSVQSLPTAAFVLFIVRLGYMGNDPINTCAAVVAGIFEVFTPISIIAYATFLPIRAWQASGYL